ncbi:2-amino-4-hydroxy-6-hydroxymethyldihydropteridine diphosphokinase [Priestia megaterium]|uniref:2-amino-4-hydroxy-6- hydroxymethyldihydropteridine diphosphokinase n=1 Tax=Priestia megaterium TaxID=1404 RepID=UPI003CFE95C8
MTTEAYIALGSNIGNRMEHLKSGVTGLMKHSEIKVVAVSSVYETAPVGYTNQASFLNMVVKIQTTYSSEHLLDCLQAIEQTAGRKREIVWGPRTLDLDILLYSNEIIHTDRLSVPHPRMFERAFVMVPLNELAPSLILPVAEEKVETITTRLSDLKDVKLFREQTTGILDMFENNRNDIHK